MLIALVLDLIIFGISAGFIKVGAIDDLSWIVIIWNTAIANYIVLLILYPLSYINEQSNIQIKSLIQYRELFKRLQLQDDILTAHPNTIKNKFFQSAVKEFLQRTVHLQGEERREKIAELVERSVDVIEYSIEEIEQELTYKPMKFLGLIALYPDTLTSILTTVATLGFAIVQSSITPEEASESASTTQR